MSSEGTPSLKKSGRMRTMTRRASSMLGISSSRSSTPAPQPSHNKDSSSASDTSSLRRSSIDRQSIDNPTSATSTPASSSSLTVATAVPEHVSEDHKLPSPIPESPAREDAANEEESRAQGRVRVPRTSLHQVVAAINETQSPPPQAKAPVAEAPSAPEQERKQSPPMPAPLIITEPSRFTTEPESAASHKLLNDSLPKPEAPAQPSSQPVSQPVSQPASQPVSQPVSQPPSQPVSQPVSQPTSRPTVPKKATDLVEPLPPADLQSASSDSYFESRPAPMESFHTRSDPEDLQKLKRAIVQNTIGESPSEDEGRKGGKSAVTSPNDVVTPRPHGPGDMENVNVYISGQAALPAVAAQQRQQPTQTVQPVQPAQPVQSVQPIQPAQPVQPIQPAQPAQPIQPVQPTQPVQSVPPIQPVQPAQPAQPVQPAQMVQPTQPIHPVQPAQPTQPARPVQPVQQVQPVQPAQTTSPVAPIMPVPVTAPAAAPVEVPATAIVKTEVKKKEEEGPKIPEVVVMPAPDTSSQRTGYDSEAPSRGVAQNETQRQDDNVDPFADPAIPIQISAQHSMATESSHEENTMPQPQPISPHHQPQPHTASALAQAPHVVYMPLPAWNEVSRGKAAPRAYDDTRPLLHTQEQGQVPQGYDYGGYNYGTGYGATSTSHGNGQHQYPQQTAHTTYLPQHFHQATIPSYVYTHGSGGAAAAGSNSSSETANANNANNTANTIAFPMLKSPLPSSQPSSRTRVSSHSHSSALPRLHHLGWHAYALPNPENTVYYVHPQMRITTDIDLGSLRVLDDVMKYLDVRRVGSGDAGDDDARGRDVIVDVGVPKGYELWLIENPQHHGHGAERSHSTEDRKKKGKHRTRGSKNEFDPLRCWVDHRKRLAQFDPIWDARVDGVGVGAGRGRGERQKRMDDVLDMEYRYWSFLESHPAHTGLPPKAHSDAMETLAWALTDRLVHPSQVQVKPPFTHEEVRELNNLLSSFGDNPDESGVQSIVHTRLVARIFMRVLHWRQIHFRPQKPLPDDVPKPAYLNYLTHQIQARNQSPSFFRTLLDVIVSILFLGIPFMLYSRAIHAQRLDAEYGLGGVGMRSMGMRDAGPLLMIGGCTCLVAAIVLSASVTFLSLPGLDFIPRIVGFVAIILAGFSMVSTVLALFSYKAEMERTSLGGEGLMVHSRRIIILSLPLAFCIYSIVAFVVGVSLYSFMGKGIFVPTETLERHFAGYTQWPVLGTVGGLGGVIAVTCAFLLV
ncbi:hypothetical protein VKT23_011764 [Stygiomarasmius scandens]|uniref:Uncharacterized protein n=1 Tax=Marasmiellus scandens TaxID=2682957 RepID=A0ABR1J8R0_9AGAR